MFHVCVCVLYKNSVVVFYVGPFNINSVHLGVKLSWPFQSIIELATCPLHDRWPSCSHVTLWALSSVVHLFLEHIRHRSYLSGCCHLLLCYVTCLILNYIFRLIHYREHAVLCYMLSAQLFVKPQHMPQTELGCDPLAQSPRVLCVGGMGKVVASGK